jgi:hypothetical protein
MRILALMCAFLLISTPSAHAGSWAVTYLDPVPSFQADVTHTVGYRVLQHGIRPYEGDLGRTGLRFRFGSDELMYSGTPLGEPGRYAVAFSLPAGRYEVHGVQGFFQDHFIGTLTVPGTLLVKPVDPSLVLTAGPGPEPAAAVVEAPREPVPVWLAGLVVAGAAGLFLLLRRRLRPSRG